MLALGSGHTPDWTDKRGTDNIAETALGLWKLVIICEWEREQRIDSMVTPVGQEFPWVGDKWSKGTPCHLAPSPPLAHSSDTVAALGRGQAPSSHCCDRAYPHQEKPAI
eukprot:TRINITY_DN25579_c0_g1_i1.p2 TRINITY_DN25579_c0_g1~~TRINITY_DN25579_c0_g1_i1.p2  ORF type:complete len:109 (-),score=0.56 TRINITY_DN25579_c0_g1_i1:17-343(-)